MHIIIAYGPPSGTSGTQKVRFYDKMGSKWNLESSNEIIVSLEDFNGHVEKCAKDFENVHGGNVIGKRNAEVRRLLELCHEKLLCVANT